MKRHYYSATIPHFINSSDIEIIGAISSNSQFSDEQTQKEAWKHQIRILKNVLINHDGDIFFEYAIPRMGQRIDVLLIINHVIFILEFKVGEKEFLGSAIDQVWDYALDLKNFHETSHEHLIAPILVATAAKIAVNTISLNAYNDRVLSPIKTNEQELGTTILNILQFLDGNKINTSEWIEGRYSPTPTIIEAAIALYNKHTVTEISRRDASAKNLSLTSNAVSKIIKQAEENNEKVICFITGVPGAGKTLVGLDVATKHLAKEKGLTSVFLSGNGPLVAILREALTRDKVRREKALGHKVKKGEIMSQVKLFIQNVHHYRDEYLLDDKAPYDHVAIFDEAQRAWDLTQTSNFMQRKKNRPNFSQSEPEFLLSCLDRHKDWAVVVCLVGGGQEINTGEAGIAEWFDSLRRSFSNWKIYVSSKITDSEYGVGRMLQELEYNSQFQKNDDLHLSVSLRSFRAEHISSLVKNLLDLDIDKARMNLQKVKRKYPIVITRDLLKAKKWLKEKARGSERYGIVVSSQAQRLKPHAIDVKTPMDPIHWFLDGKEDVRSSFYLEDVATEFHVQGLELDWTCVTWDADFRYSANGWKNYSFVGSKWNNIHKEERKLYLKNAYRVLLTRARQGMVIVVPAGDIEDVTRLPEFYDHTFEYLKQIGFEVI
jgi:hypothetical protein